MIKTQNKANIQKKKKNKKKKKKSKQRKLFDFYNSKLGIINNIHL